MPYSRNRPPAPIDKGKQGGGSRDASDITEYNKMKTIVDTNSTKIGFNNRNLVTHTSEIIRSTLLWRREIQPADVGVPVVPGQVLSTAARGALSGITFFIVNGRRRFDGNRGMSYDPVTSMVRWGIWDSSTTGPVDFPYDSTNYSFTSGSLLGLNAGLRSLRTFTAGETAQDVINELNTKLSAAPFTVGSGGSRDPPVSGGTGTSRLVASLTSDGKLQLTIVGPWYSTFENPQPYTGLAFGDAPNGSTSLGVTITGGIGGVTSSGLLIPAGQRSVIANFRIAEGIP